MTQTHDIIASSPLRFGTSGARGLVADMTDEVCFAYALAFLHIIAAPPAGRVALAMDLRPSSPRIGAACAAAIHYAGLEVENCGVLPTPALAYYAQQQGMPAIMITGSHIPYDRNGIKFYTARGEITKADETAINQAAAEMSDAITLSTLPEVNPAAYRNYVERYLRFFPPHCLAGMRLGFYEHSSAARDMLRDILEALGAEVVSLARSDAFVPVDTEAVSPADAERAKQWASENAFDGIFTTDGDADRPLIADENGRWLRGDIAGILCARYLGAEAVVTPVSSNTGVEKCAWFKKTLRTRIGSPYVIAGMEALLAGGERRVTGFEANGGFLVASPFENQGRVLEALPTRDAVLPIIALFAMAAERGIRLSELSKDLPPRHTASDRLQDFSCDKSRMLLQKLSDSPPLRQALWGDLCGAVKLIDRTDGLRITFENDEIVHLRASGNAPELRCYAEADAWQRAEVLVRESLERIQTADKWYAGSTSKCKSAKTTISTNAPSTTGPNSSPNSSGP